MLIALAVAGCGSTTNSKPAAAGTSTASAIKAIQYRGVLKVGVKVDVPKFGFKDPKSGQIDGFEIDLTRSLAKKVLGDEKKFEAQGVTAKTRGPLLDNGEVDLVIATFTITEERKQSYNFSDPYFTDGVALMVKKDSGITDLKGLADKTIGVAQSATSKKAIQEAADKQGIKVKILVGTYPTKGTIRSSLFSRIFLLGSYASYRFTSSQTYFLSSLTNQAVNLIKNTSVLAMFAGGELMYHADSWSSNNLYYGPSYVITGLLYLSLCLPLASYAKHMERKLEVSS